jgi:hypothetical protein
MHDEIGFIAQEKKAYPVKYQARNPMRETGLRVRSRRRHRVTGL